MSTKVVVVRERKCYSSLNIEKLQNFPVYSDKTSVPFASRTWRRSCAMNSSELWLMHFLLRLPFPLSHTNFGIPKLLLVAEISLAGYTIGSRLLVVLVPSSSDGDPLREKKSGRRRSSSSFRFCCLLWYVRRGSICGSRRQSWSCCSGQNVFICYSFSCNGALTGSSTIHWIIIDLQKVWPRGRRRNKLEVGFFFCGNGLEYFLSSWRFGLSASCDGN